MINCGCFTFRTVRFLFLGYRKEGKNLQVRGRPRVISRRKKKKILIKHKKVTLCVYKIVDSIF